MIFYYINFMEINIIFIVAGIVRHKDGRDDKRLLF